jgi:hypothetical protein
MGSAVRVRDIEISRDSDSPSVTSDVDDENPGAVARIA